MRVSIKLFHTVGSRGIRNKKRIEENWPYLAGNQFFWGDHLMHRIMIKTRGCDRQFFFMEPLFVEIWTDKLRPLFRSKSRQKCYFCRYLDRKRNSTLGCVNVLKSLQF